MKIQNNKTMNSLAFSLLKSSPARNFFSVTAVVLTAVLIVITITMGSGIMDSIRYTQMRTAGQNAQVSFQYLLDDDVKAITSDKLVKEYGISTFVARVTCGPWNDEPLEVRTADENFVHMVYNTPTTGTLPQNEDEIAVKSWMLDKLGIPREPGQTFPLSVQVGGVSYELKLKVCGFWDDDANLLPFGTAYISDSLADKLLKDENVPENIRNGNYAGSVQMFANLSSDIDDIQKDLNKLVSRTGIDEEICIPRINPAYSDTKPDLRVVLAVAFILLIITSCGYLLIYNIFCISVVRDIRIYGILKTIGTTSSQIKRIVNTKALIYCLFGIPTGLIIGYIVSVLLFPLFISFTSIDSSISLHPNAAAAISSVLISLVTVFISCHYPAKIASSATPAQSVKYNGMSGSDNRSKVNKSYKTSVSGMAVSNLRMHRKKTIISIISISVGLILTDVFFTLSVSYNTDKMAGSYISGDFLVADRSYLDLARQYEPCHTLSEDTVNSIDSIIGVTETAEVYYKYDTQTMIGTANTHTQLYGMDEYWCDTLKKCIIDGEFNRDRFLSGNYILVGSDRQNALKVGDKLTLGINGGKQYIVMGKVNYDDLYSLSVRCILESGISAYIPSSEIKNDPDTELLSATVFSEKEKLASVENKIKNILDPQQNVYYNSRSGYIKGIKENNAQFTFVGISLSIMILMIGILNFINTYLADIISRKYEFAVMQAIGMTNRQVRRMLTAEGLFIIAVTEIILFTIGTPVSILIIRMLGSDSGYFSYHFTALPIIISLSVLFIAAVVVPLHFYNIVSKSTIVERLHEKE